jgi:PPOX class probable F420-dependent enzyme
MAMSEERLESFLGETRVAVISTVDSSSRPRAAPIWFHWDQGHAYLFTGRRTLKWRNLERNPHVVLCVDDRDPPYASAMIEGVAEEVSDRSLYDEVLDMAVRYYGDEKGRPFAENYRENDSAVLFRVVPERIVSFESDDE